MNFFREFIDSTFGLRHYATASKIMSSVAKKVFESTRDTRPKNLDYHGLRDEAIFADTLGYVLAQEIPDDLYLIYQSLSDKEKQAIRDTIASSYKNRILSEATFSVEHDYISSNGPDFYDYSKNYYVMILPGKFSSTSHMQSMLQNSFDSVRASLKEYKEQQDTIRLRSTP